MKKILLILVPVVLLCGCKKSVDEKYTNKTIGDIFYIYTDADTCIEYFVSYGYYNNGNVFPRYNIDGTLKTNYQCLKELESVNK